MFTLIIFFPFFSFIILFFFARFLSKNVLISFSLFCLFLSFIVSICIFYEVAFYNVVTVVSLYNWICLDFYQINFGLLFDSVTCLMLIIITGVSFCVHFYSVGYMSNDPKLVKFLSFLSLFTFFMIVLVTADNFLQLFLGWEGVGLASYLLINFWYTRVLANKASLKAMIMNRIADVFFFFGICLLFLKFGTLDFITIFELIYHFRLEKTYILGYDIMFLDLVCFFLFIGSIGKSAQLFFHTWLPDAMEGPTPVSSLLHAATMVTAGVFLIIRCSPMFEYSNTVLFFICVIGGLTSLFSGLVATFQYDIKKIIAYSTCSQLGYMFFAAGLSNYHVSLFHLFNHAFFKALLFLSAGAIIHCIFDEQDMRKMGSLLNLLPFTYFCILLGSLSIMGFPFLTGFFSKEVILELTYSRYILDSYFVYFLGVFSAFLTSVYSTRLILIAFFLESLSFNKFVVSHECDTFMFIPMIFLSVCTIFVGYIFNDLIIGWGSFLWGNSVFIMQNNCCEVDAAFVSPLIKNLPLMLSFFGFLVGVFMILFFQNLKENYSIRRFVYFITNKLYSFFYNAGLYNIIYNRLFIGLYVFSYRCFTKILDKGFFEYFGPYGIYKFFKIASLKSNRIMLPSILFFSVFIMFLFIFFLFLWIALHSNIIIFFYDNYSIMVLFLFILVFEIYINDKNN